MALRDETIHHCGFGIHDHDLVNGEWVCPGGCRTCPDRHSFEFQRMWIDETRYTVTRHDVTWTCPSCTRRWDIPRVAVTATPIRRRMTWAALWGVAAAIAFVLLLNLGLLWLR